ncbi:MAG: hypothetical protein A2504_00495 [Bdellovibrionales bacterium RIFOXYD12_FULL_39_22]|nr:MAG: hypothetical protein A2385_14780 [Bdellovibrionales bacterium RIFOXYB1_FULL_39_21]OFZ43995.1 MAG: hypothetical protein A2485_12395 [Bdellovibrionales bacterium RIFOXYC12_FULL_39_17]OFZ47788.1 MAG: hypothetical protein A2404_14240 [Bdellovibrionales bacterium RIFOXYC1_FULL_39_130]OFZ76479.1 MAG: hypothetical protein A2560_17640 [Bdellovibrionales bacterium RIFOXYD1_FULL_39_84]OFZ95157.1 MAG: hypothetical protein A2504_00495 [Bdellovibrionales bacterium RIFOXYD12_FULL_39_22]HLE11657.1 po
MKLRSLLLFILTSILVVAHAKEIALTFDDAPMGTSWHFESSARTEILIKKLKGLGVPPVIIFANACNREDSASVILQLTKYKDAGHLIGNHTCSHPRLDDIGFEKYIKNIEQNEKLLTPLLMGVTFFRYPFLNESIDEKLRDEVRNWLKGNHYKNGQVSIDNDDYIFSSKINRAKQNGKNIDYKKVEALFLKHVVGAAEFYDSLAVKTLGRSPKHVILLHEMDATVMFIDSLVNEFRKQGWNIISAQDAYQDEIYSRQPKNTYTNNGFIAQLAKENTGETFSYNGDKETGAELDKILDLKN